MDLINNEQDLAALETSATTLLDASKMIDPNLGQLGRIVKFRKTNGITHNGAILHNGFYTHGEIKMPKTLPESPEWVDGIYQVELDTPVLGGDGGPDNWQAQQLANRTAYLKQRTDMIDDRLQSATGIMPLSRRRKPPSTAAAKHAVILT